MLGLKLNHVSKTGLQFLCMISSDMTSQIKFCILYMTYHLCHNFNGVSSNRCWCWAWTSNQIAEIFCGFSFQFTHNNDSHKSRAITPCTWSPCLQQWRMKYVTYYCVKCQRIVTSNQRSNPDTQIFLRSGSYAFIPSVFSLKPHFLHMIYVNFTNNMTYHSNIQI